MFEKVNPSHPDKIADRIAGAVVDLAYGKNDNPKVAVEVLIGHGKCLVVIETSEFMFDAEVRRIVSRLAGDVETEVVTVEQDPILSSNQDGSVRCGDNGIFRGSPVTEEQKALRNIAAGIYAESGTDGKYISDGRKLVICQSGDVSLADMEKRYPGRDIVLNPLGPWTGGIDVDSGATNRKLGSDMGDGVTGGGLHGKDLSKADVSVNIYAHLLAQNENRVVEFCCAIGDESVNGVAYKDIVEVAREYIKACGGFEKFAEWGLV